MTSLLSIHGLKKRFDERVLLDIPALTLELGSAYLLTGVNGSGKTTLLRILAGLEPAEIAASAFHGQSISLSPYPKELRDAIVYVHQQPVLFSTSLEKNIGYGLRARGVGNAEIKKQVGEAMAWAGVAHLRDHDPATLSGGEKQRIALARAKVLKPRLLLLDEPTANLDEAAKAQVAALIPAFVQEGGSILIVSHDHQLIDLPNITWMTLKEGNILFPSGA
ncbi:MAG: ATP-binding cassette domain-containing protein [Oxalobacter sp.]|nr:MAG: ATP-binding cassette domain-containing protein [Oxalobacter sp.]